jgi:hypothetical protein
MTSPSLTARRLLGFSLAAVLTSASVVACASPAPLNPSALPSTQLGQVGEICHAVMGIPAGVSLKTACVESLSASLAALGQGRGLQGAQGACLGKGLRPGEPALAECELTEASTRTATAGLPIDAAPPAQSAKSYFYAPQREIRRREETACARLGYEPVYGSFAACVARLDSALFDAEHAAH